MDKVLGKYLNQLDNDFPLDCETFDYIQNNNFITEILGNIAGDKCFIYGCEKSGTNNYAPGYVFLRTTDHPEGEILPFSGGSSSGRVYINSQEVSVTVNDKTYSAYTKRWLSLTQPPKYDKTVYNINEFTYASYNQPLYGEIKIWSGPVDEIPPGYHICDGSALLISEYPNLYRAIGRQYNNQHIGSRTTYTPSDYYTTSSDYFRVPDLTARFIVGCDTTEMIPGDDINGNGYAFGSQGGLSTCKLTSKQSGLPVHNHTASSYTTENGSHRHWYAADDEAKNITGYDLSTYIEKRRGADGSASGGVQKTSEDGGHSHTIHTTVYDSTVQDAAEAHENKPPFMVLCYIIRCC